MFYIKLTRDESSRDSGAKAREVETDTMPQIVGERNNSLFLK